MIPRTIHYCWFGGNSLPIDAQKCIASWKKFFPDFEIKEWNEKNFDLSCCQYVREAVQVRKWAYVSDFARMKILYENGGLYFDVDVEVIKDMSDIIERGAFLGIECNKKVTVNTGLGLAVEPGNAVIKEILDSYYKDHFLDKKGKPIYITVVDRVTKILQKYGLENRNEMQKVENFKIYPSDYFCPMDYNTGEIRLTDNTRTIHWYSASWFPEDYLRRRKVALKLKRKFGKILGTLIAYIYMKSTGAIGRIIKIGRTFIGHGIKRKEN